MKKYLHSAIAIMIILAIAVALGEWVVTEKTSLHLYSWAGFICFSIIGSSFMDNFGSEDRTVSQIFLTFSSGICCLIFLAFTLSWSEVLAATWLGTVRWSLLVIGILIYAIVSIELSESTENVKRLRAGKIEWRYIFCNTCLTAATFATILQIITSCLTNPDPLIKDYFLGFILFMAASHLFVWHTQTKIKKAYLNFLGVIIMLLAAISLLSLDSIADYFTPSNILTIKTLRILTSVSGLILTVMTTYGILHKDKEENEFQTD